MCPWFLLYRGNSGEIARSRLKLMLISDETQVNPGFLEMIRDDLVDVVSRYAEFDSGDVELRLARADRAGEGVLALAAKIPIRQFANLRNE